MNILEEICFYKRKNIEDNKKKRSIDFFKKNSRNKVRNFLNAIKKSSNDKYNVIAEIKKNSPSAGLIQKDFNLIKIAKDYEKGGAACLSILTEEKYFKGNVEYLPEVKKNVSIPILRKDFIIDEWQIYESYFYGADCILLILAILDDVKAKKFYNISKSLGMSVIVEVHDEKELLRAIKYNYNCIGINNRNLKTLQINLDTFKELSVNISADVLKICESGLSNNSILKEMDKYGANAFLIGESLMKQPNILNATKHMTTK